GLGVLRPSQSVVVWTFFPRGLGQVRGESARTSTGPLAQWAGGPGGRAFPIGGLCRIAPLDMQAQFERSRNCGIDQTWSAREYGCREVGVGKEPEARCPGADTPSLRLREQR